MEITAIITAAGISRRFGRGKNKLLANLRGKPVIAWTIEPFQNNKHISDIIITGNDESLKQYEKIVKKYKFKKVSVIIKGGAVRFASVYNALKEVKTDFVLIHDAARPVIDGKLIDGVVRELKKHNAVISAVPSKDTVKYCRGLINQTPTIEKTIARDKIYLAHTPQGFRTKAILKAARALRNKRIEFTDDAMLIELCGGKVKIAPGSYENIKITTPADFVVAEAFLKRRHYV